MEETKKDCCSKKHLCELMADKAGFDALKEAVKNPRFICKGCGRAAGEAENLCVPVSLED